MINDGMHCTMINDGMHCTMINDGMHCTMINDGMHKRPHQQCRWNGMAVRLKRYYTYSGGQGINFRYCIASIRFRHTSYKSKEGLGRSVI
jgi:hypothetical protein